MVVIGLWLGILGYGVLYAGIQKLGGDASYTFGDSFRGKAPTAHTNAATAGAGTTLLASQQATAAQQQAAVPTVPVPAFGFAP